MSSKLREAVSRLVREIEDGMLVEVSSKFECDLAKTLLVDVKSALAEPLRNCDVGTEEEQAERYRNFCHNYPKCTGCPCVGRIEYGKCEFAWSQMPYEREAK